MRLPEPTHLTSRNVTPGEIELGWENQTDEITSIVIQQSTDGGKTWQPTVILADTKLTHYRVTRLELGVTYRFRICVRDEKGKPPKSPNSPSKATASLAPGHDEPSIPTR